MNMSTLPYPNIYEDGCFAGAAEMNWLKPIFEKQIYVKFKKIPFLLFFLIRLKVIITVKQTFLKLRKMKFILSI